MVTVRSAAMSPRSCDGAGNGESFSQGRKLGREMSWSSHKALERAWTEKTKKSGWARAGFGVKTNAYFGLNILG